MPQAAITDKLATSSHVHRTFNALSFRLTPYLLIE